MTGVEPHRYPLVQKQKTKKASWNVSQICEGLFSEKDPANHLELECGASSWVYISLLLRALCSITSENDDGNEKALQKSLYAYLRLLSS